MATHADADHLAGLLAVLEDYPIERIFWNGANRDSQTFQGFIALSQAEGAEIVVPRRGDVIALGTLEITVLHPGSLSGDSNVDSIVVRVQCGNVAVMLTGDAEVPSEASMLAAGVLEDIDVLKVGHHGSQTSTSQAFLDAVRPEWGVISAGVENQYGHPHAEVVGRLLDAGVGLIATDVTDGDDTMTLTTDCESYAIRGSDLPIGGPMAPTPTTTPFPTVTATTGSAPTATATSAPIPTATPTVPSSGAANVVIECILYDGRVPRSESDEYVQIANIGGEAVNLEGWVLVAVDEGSPALRFPDYILGPGSRIRVYTNEVHPESGGFTFGYGRAVWNNREPDKAALIAPSGELVSPVTYPPGCATNFRRHSDAALSSIHGTVT